jgi:glycosyltransferase involved in cell wall biosynthesis
LIDDLSTAGTETQLLALIRNLDRRRVRPLLALLRGDGAESRSLEPHDCPVRRLGIGALRDPATILKVARFARFLRRERVEVLQMYFPDSTYVGILASRLAGVPHRIRTRNNLNHWMTPAHRHLGRLCNRFITRTVVNCEACRRAVLADEGPRPESVVVLENGVDLDRFLDVAETAGAATSGQAGIVGIVANLRPVKGLDVFVRTAALLANAHPGVQFRIAGEGEARPELAALARDFGLGGRLDLVGRVTDVPVFLGGLQVAVLASRSEGMPNAVLEYMAAGRAIVSTAVGAAPELLGGGARGLLVPPGDVAALASAIDRLLRDGDLAARLAAAARRHVRERYGRLAMVRRFERFYWDLTGRSRAAG